MADSKDRVTLWSRDFVLVTLGTLLMAVSFYFLVSLLPFYLSDMGATAGEVGVVLALFTISALAIRPFVGYWLDAYGRKPIYLCSFILFFIVYWTYPLAAGVLGIGAIRLLHGACWGAFSTSATTIAIDLVPSQRRGEGIGIYGLSMTIAMAVGPLIATTLLERTTYLYCLVAALLFCFVGLLLALRVRVPQHRPAARRLTLDYLFAFKALPPTVIIMVVMLPYGGLLSFIGLYGQEISASSVGLFYLLLSVGVALSRVLSGKVFDMVGPLLVTLGGMSLLCVGYVMIALWDVPEGYYLSAPLLGLGFGIMMPTMQAMANHRLPMVQRGAANSTFLTGLDIGIGLGMVLYGIGIKHCGYMSVFIMSAVVVLLALLLFCIYAYPHFLRSANPIEFDIKTT